jgi:hypothetical protein
VYTWDYHTSVSFWSGLKVQPIFVDEVQTFKALITVHKVLQEGHPVACVVLYKRLSQESDAKFPYRLSKKRRVRRHGWRHVQEQSERRVREVCDITFEVDVLS